MNANQIEKLRSFENMIKTFIIEDYGLFLTNEKKDYLNNNSLINENTKIEFTSSEHIQGSVIRIVFEYLFSNIKCTKNIKFSDGEHSIDYAQNIYNALVNHYTKEFADKRQIKIDDLTNKDEENIINSIINKLGPSILSIAFNCDGLTLINAANDEIVEKECDKIAVKEYISKINGENVVIKTDVKIFPLVYKNGQQYLKCIDSSGKEEFIKINNPDQVSKLYKKMLESGNVNADEFFKQITKIGEVIPFYNKVNSSSKLTSSEKELLDTIYTTTDKLLNNSNIENTQSIKVSLITEEEYEKLCMKSINNKELTKEEMLQMQYFDEYYFGKGNTTPVPGTNEKPKEEIAEENENPQMKLKPAKKSGFSNKFIPVFLIIMVIIIGAICGIAMFKIMN